MYLSSFGVDSDMAGIFTGMLGIKTGKGFCYGICHRRKYSILLSSLFDECLCVIRVVIVCQRPIQSALACFYSKTGR